MKTIYYIIFLMSFLTLAKASVIVGGAPVPEGDVPGVLNIFTDENLTSSCTASKIAQKYLITAAHCVYGRDLKVIGWSYSSHIDLSDEKTAIYGLHVKEVYINPSYPKYKKLNQTFNSSDIAVIEIDLIDGAYLQTFLKLPDLELDFSIVSPGETLSVYGYGSENRGQSEYGIYNKKVIELAGLENTAFSLICKKNFPGLNQFTSIIFKKKIITAASATSGMSEGDSGGPVLRNGKIVGINSSYLNNKDIRFSSVYLNLHTRVSEVKDWILTIIKRK